MITVPVAFPGPGATLEKQSSRLRITRTINTNPLQVLGSKIDSLVCFTRTVNAANGAKVAAPGLEFVSFSTCTYLSFTDWAFRCTLV